MFGSEASRVGSDPRPPPTFISSTHLAHRLVTYALVQSSSTATSSDPYSPNPLNNAPLSLALDIFEAHHLYSQSPSHRPTLTALAVKHGLFPSERDAAEWLDGDQLDFEVRRAYPSSGRVGVTGVPFWVIEGRWAVSGAIGVEGFVKVSQHLLTSLLAILYFI